MRGEGGVAVIPTLFGFRCFLERPITTTTSAPVTDILQEDVADC